MLADLISNPLDATTLFGLLWVRLVMLLTIAPLFSPPQTPWAIRFALSAALALGLYPASPPLDTPHELNIAWISLYFIKEALVGMLLGFVLAIPVWIAEGFGILFDNERGAMTGGTFNPLIASPSPIGALLQYAAITVLFASGGIHAILESLTLSCQVWPANSLLPASNTATSETIIQLFNSMGKITLLYFLPIMAMLILIEFGLALMSVYAPSLQAFQMAMPIKSYTGLLMLVTAMGLFWTYWLEGTDDYLTQVTEVLSQGHR